jgi:hypothetical protein
MHAGTRAEKATINRYFAGLVASVLKRLDDTRRSDNTSLLDETLVVWGTEMAIGNHLKDPIPFIIAGGAKPSEGYFHQGKLLEVSQQRTTRLLISAMHAFGMTSTQTLGDLTDDTSQEPRGLRHEPTVGCVVFDWLHEASRILEPACGSTEPGQPLRPWGMCGRSHARLFVRKQGERKSNLCHA